MEDIQFKKRKLQDFLGTSFDWQLFLSEAGKFSVTLHSINLEAKFNRLLVTFRIPIRSYRLDSEQSEKILTRRILDFKIVRNKFLRLKLGKFGSRDNFVAVLSPQHIKIPRVQSREKGALFRQILKSLVLANFKRVKFIKTRRNFSQIGPHTFVRFHVRLPEKEVLIVATNEEANQQEINKILSTGLTWYSYLRKQNKSLRDIYLIVPRGTARTILNRIAWLNKRRSKIEIFEISDERLGALRPKILHERKEYAWPTRGPFRTGAQLMKIFRLKPNLIRRYPRLDGYDSLRIFGLEFARAYGKNRDYITFGVGAAKTSLTNKNWPELKYLVEQIADKRRFDTPDRHHAFYRIQEERWLECLIMDDIKALGLELNEHFVYSQVPLYLGDERGLADILTVNRDGRLVVVEIKVDMDAELPFQGLDYLSSVHWYNQRNLYQRNGYFEGIKLSKDYPQLYLIAPLFKFHKTFEIMASFIKPQVEIFKIEVNWDWRKQLKVLRKGGVRF